MRRDADAGRLPLLMVAYHYPPEGSSSGVLRASKFSKYLPRHGWTPHVLTLRASLYPVRDEGLLADMPPDVTVHRTWAIDSARHLAVRGRHLGALTVPDRWVSWLPAGVARGLRVVRRANVRALWSTSPMPTAHLIAGVVAVATRRPWVADFRDPWIEEGLYPRPGTARYHVEARLEAFVVRRASSVTVTTEHFRRDLLRRYPDVPADRVATIFNGYDETDFAGIDAAFAPPRFEILHAGLVTPEYRDPRPLLATLRDGFTAGTLPREATRVVFLGGGSWVESPAFRDALATLGVDDVVEVLERRGHRATLERMASAAVLLLLQASDDTRTLIPAKAFEYLRVGRPILALTPDGATAELIAETSGGVVADPRDRDALRRALERLYGDWRVGHRPLPAQARAVMRYERARLTAELAALLDRVVDRTPARRRAAVQAPEVV